MNETASGRNLSGMCQPTSFLNATSSRNMSNQTCFSEPPRNTHGEAYAGHPFGEAYVLVTTSLFSVILFASLVGNILVMFTILRRKSMKTPCNYFIMNIALSDIGVGAIAAPLRILEIFASWPFGDFMCHFLWPIQDVFVCVSVLTHTTIGLERYRAIVMPLKPKITLRKTKIIIVILWLGCYCASGIPQSFLLELTDIMGWKYCFIHWPSLLFRRCYIIYLVVVFILVPLAVQTWCYIKIVTVVNSRKRGFGNSTRIVSRNMDALKQQEGRKKRLIRMLITSLVVFQLCYIPRGVLMISLEFQPVDVVNSQGFAYADLISLVLYYCKHIVNPVILFAMSADFRKAFMANVAKCRKTEQTLTSLQQITLQDSPQEATV